MKFTCRLVHNCSHRFNVFGYHFESRFLVKSNILSLPCSMQISCSHRSFELFSYMSSKSCEANALNGISSHCTKLFKQSPVLAPCLWPLFTICCIYLHSRTTGFVIHKIWSQCTMCCVAHSVPFVSRFMYLVVLYSIPFRDVIIGGTDSSMSNIKHGCDWSLQNIPPYCVLLKESGAKLIRLKLDQLVRPFEVRPPCKGGHS